MYFLFFLHCRYLSSLRGHVSAVYQIAWSADSRLLVSGSSDSTIKVWDAKTMKLFVDLPGHADEVCCALIQRIYVWLYYLVLMAIFTLVTVSFLLRYI